MTSVPKGRAIRCRKDGRAVAHLRVRDGNLYLDVVGGRVARMAARRDAWAAAVSKAEQSLQLPDEPQFALHRALADSTLELDGKADLDDRIYPESHPIPTRWDVLLRELDYEPWQHPAACPGCHDLLWLTVRPIGDGWRVDME